MVGCYFQNYSIVLINNEKVKDPGSVANAFNKFFLAITESLNLYQTGTEDAVSFLKAAFPVKITSINIIPTTETEMKSVINSLKSKNSSGYDEVRSKILKACSALISCPLTHICNHSLETGIFLGRLKISIYKLQKSSSGYRTRHKLKYKSMKYIH
jgi:hypothetical protein